MDWSRLNELALLSVSRACAFASLAIFCFMIGMAGYPLVALKSGAVLMMFSAAVLVIKAQRSPAKPYKRTELWVLLAPEERPSNRFAQQVIGTTLREMFIRFAGYFAFGAFCCFAGAMALQLVNQLFGS
jgi:hypothetical protein